MAIRLVEEILEALHTQTGVVPVMSASEVDLPNLAGSVKDVLQQRQQIGSDVDRMRDAHRLAQILISMTGVGIMTATRILLQVGDGSTFRSAGDQAPCVAPPGDPPIGQLHTRAMSGLHRQHESQTRVLRRRVRIAARAEQRACDDRRRVEGWNYNAALICVARPGSDTVHGMLKIRELYRDPAASATDTEHGPPGDR